MMDAISLQVEEADGRVTAFQREKVSLACRDVVY